ncbi:MAG: SDR family oxidoreductase [Phycisphaerae bacterium]|nr:SDR family oxidoreductase [Phycisphaerae bacterium]
MGKGDRKPPAQSQKIQPGRESQMQPRPESQARHYRGADKLKDKVAIITGGDSGIGRSVAVSFAKEGAHVVVVYLEEHQDAEETQKLVEEAGRECLLISGDIGDSRLSEEVVARTMEHFKRIDVLVNNAAEQHEYEKLTDIPDAQLLKTFKTNIFAMFYLVRAAITHMQPGSAIVNTTSVTAYRGHTSLIPYSATKGAIVSFTRSLARVLGPDIRVNAVAPGPVWTPLIPASFSAEKVEQFGSNTIMDRPAEPDEIAPCYVFLASDDSSYMTGQVLHPNGGMDFSS